MDNGDARRLPLHRKRRHCLRRVLDALRYICRTGSNGSAGPPVDTSLTRDLTAAGEHGDVPQSPDGSLIS